MAPEDGGREANAVDQEVSLPGLPTILYSAKPKTPLRAVQAHQSEMPSVMSHEIACRPAVLQNPVAQPEPMHTTECLPHLLVACLNFIFVQPATEVTETYQPTARLAQDDR